MKTARFVIVFVMLSLFATSICPAHEESAVTDLAGRKVRFSNTPERIICISPGTLRLAIYLEAAEHIIGVEDMEKRFPHTRPYWLANPELGRLPSIGPGGPMTINKEPDLEKVLAVQPDVIFISYMSKELADTLQQKIGIPIVVISYGPFGTFNEVVFDSLRLMGKVLKKERRAHTVIDYIENSRKDIASRVSNIDEKFKPSVYIGGIGFKGSHGIESTETRYAPFIWANSKNIATAQGMNGHVYVDKEKILQWNPDVVFIDSGGNEIIRQDFIKKPGFYQSLQAFQQKRVYLLHSFNWYMTNLGTVIANAYAVGKKLYPDRFHDVDPPQKSDEIYSFLVGRPVYHQMSISFGQLGKVPAYLKP
ncbi:iron ABC transporter substrate-binding protein [bacterium]|nr:iron ABC transporter substrate-binding protein [bacterium]